MPILISDTWPWFTIAFGIMLLATFIMSRQSKNFYTRDVVERRFSIMELELPATPQELVNIIAGIYRLSPPKDAPPASPGRSEQVVKALRGQLIIDLILFMPFTYGGIFLLCMRVAAKMEHDSWGQKIFSVLAWLQILAFILDILENIYLLRKIKPQPSLSTLSVYRAYQLLELFKWGLPLLAAVSSLSCLFYFWVSGNYSSHAYPYLLIVGGEIILFIIAGIVSSRKPAKTSMAYSNV